MEQLSGANWGNLATGRIASDQGERCGVLLHTYAQRTIIGATYRGNGAINDIEGSLAFVVAHFEVERDISCLSGIIIGSAPFDVKDAVRCRSAGGSEDAQVRAGIIST